MTSIEQLARVVCLPIALGLFLIAAQTSGGLELRSAPIAHVAMK